MGTNLFDYMSQCKQDFLTNSKKKLLKIICDDKKKEKSAVVFPVVVTNIWIFRRFVSVLSEKTADMKSEKCFEKVCELLSQSKLYRSRNVGFDNICVEAGVARVEMDNLLYERFGMSGSDMLDEFRKRSL